MGRRVSNVGEFVAGELTSVASRIGNIPPIYSHFLDVISGFWLDIISRHNFCEIGEFPLTFFS